jgi:protoheme IX farnesyltransferase
MKLFLNLFKLRIGVVIALTAVAGIAVSPGPGPKLWQSAVLTLAVLIASAAAGAFNQYAERDLDVRMRRTRNRPFVTGELRHGKHWLAIIALMIVGAVAGAALAVNPIAALYVFLGAFFYAVVYTVWLKRRTWTNIVIGGLAGSFAVMAGAAAVSTEPSAEALALALVLFLWTPPHFWSLAIAYRDDYEAAGVPMLPVLVGDRLSAHVILWHAVALVAASLIPAFFSLGAIYLVSAVAGGAYLLQKSVQLVRAPSRATALANFHATLIQLSLLLLGAMLDAAVGG